EPHVALVAVGEQARGHVARGHLFELPPPVVLDAGGHLEAGRADRQVGRDTRAGVADALGRRRGRVVVELEPLVTVSEVAAHRAPASAIPERAVTGHRAVPGIEDVAEWCAEVLARAPGQRRAETEPAGGPLDLRRPVGLLVVRAEGSGERAPEERIAADRVR